MDKDESSSPMKEVVSPLGVSRYGRTRKPKISADFCHIDDALQNEEPPVIPTKSPVKSPKQGEVVQKKIVKTPLDKRLKTKTKTGVEPEVLSEVAEDIENEGLKVLNDVFESSPMDDVLKIIGVTKSPDVSTNEVKKRSPCEIRKYVNKRKIVTPQSRIIESFGLPDDPIIPMYGEKLIFKPFKDLDVDESSPDNVTLVDDFLENIFKEEIDDKVELKNGDLSKNGENHRNLYTSKSFNELFLDEMEMKLEETKKELIDIQVDDNEKNSLDEDLDESFFSLRVTKSDLLKTYNKRKTRKSEKVDENQTGKENNISSNDKTQRVEDKQGNKTKQSQKNLENGLMTINVITAKESFTKWNSKKKTNESLEANTICGKESINEIAMKIKENYDKISRDSLRNKNHILFPIENKPGGEISEVDNKLDNKSDKIIQESIKIDSNLNELELKPNETRSESIGNEAKSSIVELKSNKIEPKENENEIVLKQEATQVQEFSINTQEAKEGILINDPLGAEGNLEMECKIKIEKDDTKHIPINYECLEYFEHCSSEGDVAPLSNLKNKIAAGAKSKKYLKKDAKKEMEEVNKPARSRMSREKKTTLPKKRLIENSKTQSKIVDEFKTEFDVFNGQLMWAKLGTYPYWPCMITADPESKRFTKDHTHRKICHVRFFGDKGRRAWIRKKQLLPYCSTEELLTYPSITKADVFPSKHYSYKQRWDTAVNEANSLQDKSLKEKLSFFEDVLKKQDEAKEQRRMQRRETISKKRKQEPIVEEVKPEVVVSGRVTRSSENGKLESSLKRNESNLEDLESESGSDDISLQEFPSNMEEQIALYKRNNLFKKITRKRVCQICLKLGAVWRCKGKCQGCYHGECAEKTFLREVLNGIKEESLIEDKSHLKIDKIDDLINNEIIMSTNTRQVEIISIKDRKRLTPTNLTLNNDVKFKSLPLFDQIDHKMIEVMKDLGDKALYLESSTECSFNESSRENSPEKPKREKNKEISSTSDKAINELYCRNCLDNIDPLCFVCHKEISKNNSAIRQRCSWIKCGKFYHPECLKIWPQTQWSITSSRRHKLYLNSNEFTCPMHICHTCVSDDPRSSISRCYGDKLVKCLYCPSTYHTATYCVPAGTQILSSTQIICPTHASLRRSSKKHSHQSTPINTTWCFICSKGGTLICCETCPTSVHADCLDIKYTDDDKFICEDCETGRLPLYDEVVWAKLGAYRWWPAIILFPNEVPEKVKNRHHNPGEFVVKFFGTYDHYWIGKGRVFLFQEGDTGGGGTNKRKMEEIFRKSIDEATTVHLLKKEFKESILREAEGKSKNRPPPYVRIKVNRPVGNVRQFDGNISNTTPCECDPKQKNPCGPDSDCLNRLLLTECDPTVCPAGDKCQNQNFEQRTYPNLVPYKTEARGWGLRSAEPLKKGQFVIEYVGEMIDEQEYQRRIKHMHELKEENYYFLTIDKDRMIDAGPKGNLARFMNHSCQPNCETQKWTVNGDTRVGLFAMDNIPANTELTFNYNLECIGKEMKICKCGAPNCSGFIGVKVRPVVEVKRKVKTKKFKKKRSPTPIIQEISELCFVCGLQGELRPCDSKICSNHYHLKCVELEEWPEGKWICPRHNCSFCAKRTIRCCVKCLNSYCPKHSQGNIRYDKQLGFICSIHDPWKTIPTPTEETEVTSTTADLPEELHLPLVNISSETSDVVTSTPYKTSIRNKLNKRKRGDKFLEVKPAKKRRKFSRKAPQKCKSGDSSRTLRSATVNSSSDNMQLKLRRKTQ